ncbi:MAG: cysteine desulfurase [Lachnospiraceae bacterium]|jgi:cysteine desulfurase|nr:cysteine desulfurase [Lachnospiraceae bacterium]
MEVYFDNAATTRAFPEVCRVVAEAMGVGYGNPSSKHNKGMEAEMALRKASKTIADSLKAREKEIWFTSGGTESNNTAIFGVAEAYKRSGRHIVTTKMEHPSVLEAIKELEKQGFEVTYLGSGVRACGDMGDMPSAARHLHTEAAAGNMAQGGFLADMGGTDGGNFIDIRELTSAIRPDTIMVSIQALNNEIGAVSPIEQIGKRIKEVNPRTVFHVDAVQAYGKYPIFPGRQYIDLLSASAHKIHGPKGVGFLYVKDGVKCRPMMYGGGQQRGVRSGTENVPGILGMAEAAAHYMAHREDIVGRMEMLRGALYRGLGTLGAYVGADAVKRGEDDDPGGALVPNVGSQPGGRGRLGGRAGVPALTGTPTGVPVLAGTPTQGGIFMVSGPSGGYGAHIVCAAFAGVRAEVLLHALEEKGIYVSSGSACSSNHPGTSATLEAVGVPRELLDCAIRFSFGAFNTPEEVEYTIDVLGELLPKLRRYAAK